MLEGAPSEAWARRRARARNELNAFDTVYQLRDGTGIGVGAPQYGPRRSVYASVTKSF